MPMRTFISKEKSVPKLKVGKDHITLLLYRNMVEDFTRKLIIVFLS